MAYELTEHARDALEKRNIELAWVERVIDAPEAAEPDPVDADLEHRLARIAEGGNRVLRVIVNRKTIPPRIVTAFFDRRRTIP
ncbi:MAG: DUF4258 domain-containing protein [Candidatus Binatia bacterium]